jgi:hypothetical protein
LPIKAKRNRDVVDQVSALLKLGARARSRRRVGDAILAPKGPLCRQGHFRMWPVSTVRCDAEKRTVLGVKRKSTSRARNVRGRDASYLAPPAVG